MSLRLIPPAAESSDETAVTEAGSPQPLDDDALARMVAVKTRELELLRDSPDDDSQGSLPPVVEALHDLGDLAELSFLIDQLARAGVTMDSPSATHVMADASVRLLRLADVAVKLRRYLPDLATMANLDDRLARLIPGLVQLAARIEPEGDSSPRTVTRAQIDLSVGFTRLMDALYGSIGDLLAPRIVMPLDEEDPLDATAVVVHSPASAFVPAVCTWAATFLPASGPRGRSLTSA